MQLLAAWSALGCSLSVAACSADNGEPPGISGAQFSLPVALERRPSAAWLLVADDAEESRPIREAVLLEVTPERLQGSSVAARDPAVWDPIDLSAVIVRPSRGADPYVTPADDADLRWLAEDGQDPAALARFTAALERWFVPSETAAATEPALLEAYAAAQSVVTGAREPASAPEQEVADGVAPAAMIWTLLDSAREDASALAPESYAVALDPARQLLHVVAPPLVPDAGQACGPERAATPRFAAWLEAQADEASVQTWPCTGFEALPRPFVDAVPRCITRGPELDDAGAAACVLSVAIDPELECPNERGWFDPDAGDGRREPRFVTLDGERKRVCEIVQLAGTDLEACRTEWAWDTPAPGWCWTALTEWNEGCPQGRREVALRITGGANLGPSGVAELTCIGESFGAE